MGRYFIKDNPEPFFYVKKFGYEIEGGFESEVTRYDDDSEEDRYGNQYFKEDGSVSVDSGEEGEIASPVFYADKLGLKHMTEFVINNMPIDVNRSCGHHVHISTNNDLAYSKLMDKEFYIAFRNGVFKEFQNESKYTSGLRSRFNSRFKGREYCWDYFSPNSQAHSNDGSYIKFDGNEEGRYTQLNYCKGIHGTLECRVFPASRHAEEVISINLWFIKFVNNYLKKQPYERFSFDKMTLDNNHYENREEKIVCV